MIAADIGAILNGASEMAEVGAMIFDALLVMNHAAVIGAVIVRAPTFRDFDDRAVIVAGNAHEQIVNGARPDFPSYVGRWTFTGRKHLYRKQGEAGIEHPLRPGCRRSLG